MKTRAEFLDYVRAISADLARLADSQKWDMLAYLFRMARLEADKLTAAPTDVRQSTRRQTEAAPLGYWEWDVVHDRMFGDERTAEFFNLDKDAGRRGLPLSEWQHAVHPDDTDHVAAQLMNSIEVGSEYNPKFRVISPDQTVRYVEAHGRCLFDTQGRPARFPGTIHRIHQAPHVTEVDIDLMLKRGQRTH